MTKPTQKDIAEKLGISQMTVSLALRGASKIPEDTRCMIIQTARKIGYRRDAFASGLASRKTKGGGIKANLATVVGHKDENPIKHVFLYQRIYKGIQARAEQLGYGMELFWRYAPENRGIKIIRTFNSRNIQGVILLGIHESEINLIWENYAVSYAYRSFVNRPDMRFTSFSRTCRDWYNETLFLLLRLKSRGYSRIGMLWEEAPSRRAWGRYIAAYKEFYRLVQNEEPPPVYFRNNDVQKDRKLVEWVFTNNLDCVFVPANTERSHGILTKSGLRIPKDIGFAVVGCITPETPFTGYCIPAERLGSATVDLVIGSLTREETGIPEFPKSVVLGSTWNEGKTAPVRS